MGTACKPSIPATPAEPLRGQEERLSLGLSQWSLGPVWAQPTSCSRDWAPSSQRERNPERRLVGEKEIHWAKWRVETSASRPSDTLGEPQSHAHRCSGPSMGAAYTPFMLLPPPPSPPIFVLLHQTSTEGLSNMPEGPLWGFLYFLAVRMLCLSLTTL